MANKKYKSVKIKTKLPLMVKKMLNRIEELEARSVKTSSVSSIGDKTEYINFEVVEDVVINATSSSTPYTELGNTPTLLGLYKGCKASTINGYNSISTSGALPHEAEIIAGDQIIIQGATTNHVMTVSSVSRTTIVLTSNMTETITDEYLIKVVSSAGALCNFMQYTSLTSVETGAVMYYDLDGVFGLDIDAISYIGGHVGREQLIMFTPTLTGADDIVAQYIGDIYKPSTESYTLSSYYYDTPYIQYDNQTQSDTLEGVGDISVSAGDVVLILDHETTTVQMGVVGSVGAGDVVFSSVTNSSLFSAYYPAVPADVVPIGIKHIKVLYAIPTTNKAFSGVMREKNNSVLLAEKVYITTTTVTDFASDGVTL